jgi:hypothetical protein
MTYQKFFIVGCPRSGTTLLQQALNRHSQVAIPPETAFFTLLGLARRHQYAHLQRLSEDLGIILPSGSWRLQTVSEARVFYEETARRYVHQIGKPGITHFGEKTPEHLSRLSRIRAVFPGSKVICIFRDGRDVSLSLQSLPWTSRNLYVNFALWLHCCRLQKWARRSCHLPLHFVRYENLVANPEKELRTILAFLDLPFEAQVMTTGGNTDVIPAWEYGWKGRATQPISTDRIGLWRRQLPPDQVGVLERWGGEVLREWGYPLATDGRHPLPWFFNTRVGVRSLLWLARRPLYGQHKSLWLAQCGGRSASRPDRQCEESR